MATAISLIGKRGINVSLGLFRQIKLAFRIKSQKWEVPGMACW